MDIKTLWNTFAIILLIIFSTGCTTVDRISEDESVMFDLSVKIAVSRVIKGDPQRAEQLLIAATNLKALANRDESTVEAIRAAIYDYADKEDFSPDEKLLLNELSIIVARELETRVRDNLVSAEYSVLIARVADLVIESATFFLETRTI